jgi:hypothetical protein
MAHAKRMAERLPPLYREGELIAGVLGVPGVAVDVLDEDMLGVQVAHWFDRAVEQADVARLAELLDLVPEPWQTVGLFRAWVHAFRDALLREGAVTTAAITSFVRAYGEAFQSGEEMLALPPLDEFESAPSPTRAALVENPVLRREQRTPTTGGIEPLHQFELVNGSLDPAPVSFLVTGLPDSPECVPLIANVTTGEALVYLGHVETGRRVWIGPDDAGLAVARLEREAVTDRLISITGLEPGRPWDAPSVVTPARALTLLPGTNALWFLPVAHFDRSGLDRFLLALAGLDLREGRYDETAFDSSLFYLDPAMTLHAVWEEAEPAAFDVQLPAGTLRHAAGAEADARAARERLRTSLQASVDRLRATGVRGGVAIQPFRETQRAADALVSVQPMVRREIGPTGADAMPDAGGVFGVTSFDDSTYR